MYVVKKVVRPQESLSKKKFSMRSNMAVSEALENEHRGSRRSSEECSQIVFSVYPILPRLRVSESVVLSGERLCYSENLGGSHLALSEIAGRDGLPCDRLNRSLFKAFGCLLVG